MEKIKVTDIDGKSIEVTNLQEAIVMADYYRQIRVDDPSEHQKHLYVYWEDFYQKLLILKAQIKTGKE